MLLKPALTLSRDHFDRKVEDSLRRSLPIITTPHAKSHLADAKEGDEKFTSVYAIDTFDSMIVHIDDDTKETTEPRKPAFKVTAMPGEHVKPGILSTLNDFLKAVSKHDLLISSWFIFSCRDH